MAAWEELLRMCNLDITLTMKQEDWDAAFDRIAEKAGKGDGSGLARADWQDLTQPWEALQADGSIFIGMSGSNQPTATINKSAWQAGFEMYKVQIVEAKTKLEVKKLLRSLSLEQCIADALPQESLQPADNMENPLAGFFKLQEGHVKQLIDDAMPKIQKNLNDTLKHIRDALAKANGNSSNTGARFTAIMKGKKLSDFYTGVTGLVGEPDIDLKEGMKKEHEVLKDAEWKFTTNNYGITTDPKREHSLISMFEGEGGDKVKVGGTRRCKADGIMKEAKVRVLSSFESDASEAADLKVGLSGIVKEIDEEGHALIKFDEHSSGKTVAFFEKVCKANFDKLDGMPEADRTREGAKVKVRSEFKSDAIKAVTLEVGQEGLVSDLDDDGHAFISFGAYTKVHKGKFKSLESIPKDDVRTIRPIKHFLGLDWVRKAKLTWHEVLAVVLYTGPMFMLYNGILRGFGDCGDVEEGVAFYGKDGHFETQFKAKTIALRIKKSRNWFPATIHCLSSAVKKLQGLNSGVQGTWLYRGLGGLNIQDFLIGNGFTEPAFTSTTKELKVALEYSGVKKGLVGTVLAVEMAEVDQGAELMKFSQYPAEAETLWNSCSYMEALKGKEEWKITEWGPVRVQYIKVNASGKAMTVEELEARRQNIVVNMLKVLRDDICRDLQKDVEKEDFEKRASLGKIADQREHTRDFREKAENECRAIVDRYDYGHARLKELTLDSSFSRAQAMQRCAQEVERGRLPYRHELYEGTPPYGRLLINGGRPFGGDKWTPVHDGDTQNENGGISWVQVGEENCLGMNYKEYQEVHTEDKDWGLQARTRAPHVWCVMPHLTSQDPTFFHMNSQFAEAVSSAATMPELSKSWIRCYIEDDGKRLEESAKWDFHSSPQELRSIRLRKLEATRFEKDTPAERRGARTRNERRQEAIDEMLEGLA